MTFSLWRHNETITSSRSETCTWIWKILPLPFDSSSKTYYKMEVEAPTEVDALIPSSGARRRRGKRAAPRRRRRIPKYRDMIMRVIKALNEPKGVTLNAVVKGVAIKYKKHNVFVVKHVMNWLVSKRVLCRRKGRFQLTGRKLKLLPRAGKKKKVARRRKSKRGKRKSKKGKRKQRRRRRR